MYLNNLCICASYSNYWSFVQLLRLLCTYFIPFYFQLFLQKSNVNSNMSHYPLEKSPILSSSWVRCGSNWNIQSNRSVARSGQIPNFYWPKTLMCGEETGTIQNFLPAHEGFWPIKIRNFADPGQLNKGIVIYFVFWVPFCVRLKPNGL